ncbi:hypothetical protein Droror1_Dr00027376 [Drosera rotundifolia]
MFFDCVSFIFLSLFPPYPIISHATLGLYKKLVNRAPKALNRWEMCGQVKVLLKTETENDMLVLQVNRGGAPVAPNGTDMRMNFVIKRDDAGRVNNWVEDGAGSTRPKPASLSSLLVLYTIANHQ